MLIQNNQRKTAIKSSGKALNNYYVNVVENLVNDPAINIIEIKSFRCYEN